MKGKHKKSFEFRAMTEGNIDCRLEFEWDFHEIEHFHEWQIGSNLCVVTLNAIS